MKCQGSYEFNEIGITYIKTSEVEFRKNVPKLHLIWTYMQALLTVFIPKFQILRHPIAFILNSIS